MNLYKVNWFNSTFGKFYGIFTLEIHPEEPIKSIISDIMNIFENKHSAHWNERPSFF